MPGEQTPKTRGSEAATQKVQHETNAEITHPEFDVEEADHQTLSAADGGMIGDIEHLRSVIEALQRLRTEETREVLAKWITRVFVFWTTIGVSTSLPQEVPGSLSLMLAQGHYLPLSPTTTSVEVSYNIPWPNKLQECKEAM